jgi:FixJ family two-component response regulator
VIDPTIVSRLFARRRAGPLEQLTEREREVLALLAEGRMSGSSWNFDGDLRVDGQTVTGSAAS